MKIQVPDHIAPSTELGRVHFIGIGGAGLSAIARLMAAQGVQVSGSDAVDSQVLQSLRAEGLTCFVGHDAANVDGVDTVIASTAVHEDNPEVQAALAQSIRLWPRSAGLQSVLASRRTVAVAGTHGKTTTSAMLTCALLAAGADPSFAIGAQVPVLGTNARLGTGDVLVAEADESDGAFLVYRPAGAIVTNVDADHLDNYGTEEAYAQAFEQFVRGVSQFVVVNRDDAGAVRVGQVAQAAGQRVISAGFGAGADVRGHDIVLQGSTTTLRVTRGDEDLGELTLAVPGHHYAQDALLALAAGLELGLPAADLMAGLLTYTGADRRMQPVGEVGGVRVYDSYAHHPTEIKADLVAARSLAGTDRLVVAYQSHLVSRTRLYGAQMGRELSAADRVFLADIYLAREQADPAVTPALIADAVQGPEVTIAGPVGGLAQVLAAEVGPGDFVLTLGAGDITTVGPQLLDVLRQAQ